MTTTPRSQDRWVVSARTHGEVLAAATSAPGLEIRVFGIPHGFLPAEVEGWIASLAAAAREGAGAAAPDDTLPPTLRHVLGGLLFSHAELWEGSDGAPCSIVLVNESGRLAFGRIGEAAVEIYVDGACIVPEWVSVRDHLGNEALGWSGDARRDTRIEIALALGSALTRVEAHWTAAAESRAAAVPLALEPEGEAESEAPAGAWTPGFAESPLTASGGLDLSSQLAGSESSLSPGDVEPLGGREERSEESSTEHEEASRPSTGVARWLKQIGTQKPALTELATHETTVGAEARGMPPPQSVAGAPHVIILPESAASPAPPLPDRIPPTPEPLETTARAVRVERDRKGNIAQVDDPRALDLSGAARGLPPRDAHAAPEAPDPGNLVIESSRRFAPPGGEAEAIRVEDRWTPSLAPPSGGQDVETPPEQTTTPDLALAPAPKPRRAAAPRRPEWTASSTSAAGESGASWVRWAAWSAFVLLLFGGGWLMGSFQNVEGVDGKASPAAALLRSFGIKGARFQSVIRSTPEGARITVDGQDTGRHTPADFELTPGEHRVDLAFPDLGGASYTVKGAKGEKVALNAKLWGTLAVTASDPATPIAVAVDGIARGFAPLTLDSLSPGAHQLRFTGPGMASWGLTAEVRVGESREVLAYPLQSPATGLLHVRAIMNREGDTQPLNGARIWIDGKTRGVTPLTLEVARGPHSVRVARQQEEAPVQVIDLPGGNQRFATFEFGLGASFPRITLAAPPAFSLEQPALITATVSPMAKGDVREMWLHVRAETGWRRYPMAMLDAQGGVAGTAPFPATLFSSQGSAPYYVSVVTVPGDEIYTEIQTAVAKKPR